MKKACLARRPGCAEDGIRTHDRTTRSRRVGLYGEWTHPGLVARGTVRPTKELTLRHSPPARVGPLWRLVGRCRGPRKERVASSDLSIAVEALTSRVREKFLTTEAQGMGVDALHKDVHVLVKAVVEFIDEMRAEQDDYKPGLRQAKREDPEDDQAD